MNNSFREFKEYIEDIKVSEIPFKIQETASKFISKTLVELEKDMKMLRQVICWHIKYLYKS